MEFDDINSCITSVAETYSRTQLRGVYFLVDDERRVLYVGKTVDLEGRVRSHHVTGWHGVSFVEVPLESQVSLEDVETFFIRHFNPPLNSDTMTRSWRKRGERWIPLLEQIPGLAEFVANAWPIGINSAVREKRLPTSPVSVRLNGRSCSMAEIRKSVEMLRGLP